MTNECTRQPHPDEEAAPWSCAGLAHRVATLEQVIVRHESRFVSLDAVMGEHREEVAALTKMNEATLTTLVKMQETLELMKEVLTTYNHVKSFGMVFGSLGKTVIFLVKAAIACAAIYGFIKFGKVPE